VPLRRGQRRAARGEAEGRNRRRAPPSALETALADEHAAAEIGLPANYVLGDREMLENLDFWGT
jgi:hypothetical protein